MTVAPRDDVLSAFDGFGGRLLRPGDEDYDEARRIHNTLIDRRPALIAECTGTADVVTAVNAAREHGIEITVRGGGHNVAGLSVRDDALLVDLSRMKGIHVDPEARTVRAQGGVRWSELNRETQLHGLAVTGGAVSTTGIAGLTLGGGLGWLLGKHGLAADNLVSAEVVTADGRVVTASGTTNADLFWGLRGGGGNFGVVTSFEYRLHPVGPMIFGGLVAHPIDGARDLLRLYREVTQHVPDELTLFAGLTHAPDGSGAKIAVIAGAHVGDLATAERDLAAVRSFGSPILDVFGPMPYTALNQMLDGGFPPAPIYWRSSFLDGLSDAAIDTIVDRFLGSASAMSAILLEHFHGAVTRVPVDATPVQHRSVGYNCLVSAVWTDPADTDANVAWARGTYDALAPFLSARRWLNYADVEGDDQARLRAAYGPNYERLRLVKRDWDPTNLFHVNQNIPPA